MTLEARSPSASAAAEGRRSASWRRRRPPSRQVLDIVGPAEALATDNLDAAITIVHRAG
jgi:hypothetical protein